MRGCTLTHQSQTRILDAIPCADTQSDVGCGLPTLSRKRRRRRGLVQSQSRGNNAHALALSCQFSSAKEWTVKAGISKDRLEKRGRHWCATGVGVNLRHLANQRSPAKKSKLSEQNPLKRCQRHEAKCPLCGAHRHGVKQNIRTERRWTWMTSARRCLHARSYRCGSCPHSDTPGTGLGHNRLAEEPAASPGPE